MSNDKSRAAFEAWWDKHTKCMPCSDNYGPASATWAAWQASRKVALNDAISAIETANAHRHIDLADCVQIIGELK